MNVIMMGRKKEMGATRRCIAMAVIAACLLWCPSAFADAHEWKCALGSDTEMTDCDPAVLSDPTLFQFLFFPTGFQVGEKEDFFSEVNQIRTESSADYPGNEVYTNVYSDRILYIAYWIEGGKLDTEDAVFNGRLTDIVFRIDPSLTLDEAEVYETVDALKFEIPSLEPATVLVLFNNTVYATQNATPPNLSPFNGGLGISRLARTKYSSSLVPAHEAGHGFVAWLDEYIEDEFIDMNIRWLDLLTPLALWDGTMGTLGAAVGDFLGIYDMNISEVYVAGSDNVSLSTCPTTVGPHSTCDDPEYEDYHEIYESEGALFGKGTFRDDGRNLMRHCYPQHTESQERVIDTIFDGAENARPNDRLRNAGPNINRLLHFGTETTVLAYDEDKHHNWHPTLAYDVELSWNQSEWQICYFWNIPYPCLVSVSKTVRKEFSPTEELVNLENSSLYIIAPWALPAFCLLTGNQDFLCQASPEELLDTVVPNLGQPLWIPYQPMAVPTPRVQQNYSWRFRTRNGPECDIDCDDGEASGCEDCSGWTAFSTL